MVRQKKRGNELRNLTPLDLATALPEVLLPEGAGVDFFRVFVGAARPWLPDCFIWSSITGKDGHLHAHCTVFRPSLRDTPADAGLAMED
ncbi:MAG: hypothetical protein WCS01_09250 [bacterium]